MRSASHVAVRFLLARAQLAPALDLIERLVNQEKWSEAKEAMQSFCKTLGVFFLGPERVSIHSPWLSGLDNEDQERFLKGFVPTLQNIWEPIYSKVASPE